MSSQLSSRFRRTHPMRDLSTPPTDSSAPALILESRPCRPLHRERGARSEGPGRAVIFPPRPLSGVAAAKRARFPVRGRWSTELRRDPVGMIDGTQLTTRVPPAAPLRHWRHRLGRRTRRRRAARVRCRAAATGAGKPNPRRRPRATRGLCGPLRRDPPEIRIRRSLPTPADGRAEPGLRAAHARTRSRSPAQAPVRSRAVAPPGMPRSHSPHRPG